MPYLVENSQDIKRILKIQGQALCISASVILLTMALQMYVENEILMREKRGEITGPLWKRE